MNCKFNILEFSFIVKLKAQLKPSPGQSKKQIGDESTQFIDVVADLIFNEVIETKISSHFQSAQMTVPAQTW